MKIIINTSNLYVGGGVQVSVSFINELYFFNNNDYYIFLSEAVNKQIDTKNFPSNFHFYRIKNSPASLKTRKKIVAKLNLLEKQINPDIVFSVFGPSYWKPRTRHMMGFAIPWVHQPKSVAYNELGFFKRMKMRLWVKYVPFYTKCYASYYIIETEDGKSKLSNVLNIEKDKIFVVGNSYSSVFDNQEYLLKSNPNYIQLPKKEKEEYRLFLISHNYPHKNLKIINKIIPLLNGLNIKFILTIDDVSYKQLFPLNNDKILNLGPISQKACPSIYEQCDIMFLPTFLEVFSAAYPEAMKMQKNILTSNYSFAKDICKGAALYFNPLEPEDIAHKIKHLVNDKNLQAKLIKNGNERLKKFETSKTRAEKYLEICENIIRKAKNVQK